MRGPGVVLFVFSHLRMVDFVSFFPTLAPSILDGTYSQYFLVCTYFDMNNTPNLTFIVRTYTHARLSLPQACFYT